MLFLREFVLILFISLLKHTFLNIFIFYFQYYFAHFCSLSIVESKIILTYSIFHIIQIRKTRIKRVLILREKKDYRSIQLARYHLTHSYLFFAKCICSCQIMTFTFIYNKTTMSQMISRIKLSGPKCL